MHFFVACRKKLPRVTLCVSPKGIEMFDAITGDTLLQVSIYKISYCSADAAHPDVFAFVGTECGPDIDPLDEQLTCYAFLCAKRKHAQKVTLTVAHSFEQAYQIWQEASTRKQYQLERRAARKQQLQLQQTTTTVAPSMQIATEKKIQRPVISYRKGSSYSCSDDDHPHDVLIDLATNSVNGNADHSSSSGGELTDDLLDKDRHRTILQNTWVSFDEDDADDAATAEAVSASTTRTVWDTTLKSACI